MRKTEYTKQLPCITIKITIMNKQINYNQHFFWDDSASYVMFKLFNSFNIKKIT